MLGGEYGCWVHLHATLLGLLWSVPTEWWSDDHLVG